MKIIHLCLAALSLLVIPCLSVRGQPFHSPVHNQPRIRVIADNDYGGDPDGLFQLAHLLLSPTVEIRGIIGSHLALKDGFDNSDHQTENAVAKVKSLLNLMKVRARIPIIAGPNYALANDTTPIYDEAAKLIVQEAMRADTRQPLYVLCGGGLTEVASALLSRPEIAGKFILVWIGGPEYPGVADQPPGASNREYNLNIDLAAAKAVFNHSTVGIWQVPRNAYRQCLVSFSQLSVHVKPRGALGAYLYQQLENIGNKWHISGETYILGDSPLVLLTALQSFFEPDPSSSGYTVEKAPFITNEGQYKINPEGRKMRVYNRLDTRLMFSDFFDKLELFAGNIVRP